MKEVTEMATKFILVAMVLHVSNDYTVINGRANSSTSNVMIAYFKY